MSYERTPIPTAALEDLDQAAMRAYVAERAPSLLENTSLEVAAGRLGLLGKVGPRMLPTAVGLLLFGHAPQLLRPEWGVSAVAFDGRTIGDPIRVRRDLEGPVAKLLASALGFVREHTRSVNDEIHPSAQHHPEHPEAAVREAVVNALIHRDLRKSGRVAVRVFDDRLEVWSPGGVGEALADLDEAVQHGGVSFPRNPLLAATARLLGIGEQIGRGLVLMRRAVMDAGGNRLSIRATQREMLVVFPSPLFRPLTARPLT